MVCKECGRPYVGHPQSKYCDICRPIVKARQRRESKERWKERKHEAGEKRHASREKRKVSIDEIAKAARSAGMTYGQYVASHRL